MQIFSLVEDRIGANFVYVLQRISSFCYCMRHCLFITIFIYSSIPFIFSLYLCSKYILAKYVCNNQKGLYKAGAKEIYPL